MIESINTEGEQGRPQPCFLLPGRRAAIERFATQAKPVALFKSIMASHRALLGSRSLPLPCWLEACIQTGSRGHTIENGDLEKRGITTLLKSALYEYAR